MNVDRVNVNLGLLRKLVLQLHNLPVVGRFVGWPFDTNPREMFYHYAAANQRSLRTTPTAKRLVIHMNEGVAGCTLYAPLHWYCPNTNQARSITN